MKRIKSMAESRLIIEGSVNGKAACFLIDTGASVGMMDYGKRHDYGLLVGRKYGGTIVGAGGIMRNVRHCDSFLHLEGKVVPQFLLADIGGVVESIRRETGVEILGIISLRQMELVGMNIDVNSHEVWLE